MNRLVKIILVAVTAVVVLVIGIVVALALFFDANSYRGEIAARVEKSTGRTLTMGSIHLSIFPMLGLRLDNASLGNPKGFGDRPFATVGEADVGVRLLPLLMHRRLEIGSVYLSGLTLNLERNESGRTNWVLVRSHGQGGQRPRATVGPSGGMSLAALDVAGIKIEDAAIRYHDLKTGRKVDLNHFNLSAGALRPGQPCAFRTSFVVWSNHPAVRAQINSSGQALIDPSASHYQVRDYSLGVDASGAAVPAGKQIAKLTGDVSYNDRAGTARLNDLTLHFAGTSTHANIQFRGIGTSHLTWGGPIKISRFNPHDTLDALGIREYPAADASALKKASFSALLTGTTTSASLRDVELTLDQTTASGSLSVDNFSAPAVDVALKVDTINVDRYLPATESTRSNGTAPRGKHPPPGGAPLIPLKLLDAGTVHGTLNITHLVAHGLRFSNVAVRLNAVRGRHKDMEFTAALYGGDIASSTIINPGSNPRYHEKFKLSNVAIGPLLKDALGRDPLTGHGDVDADLATTGRTLDGVKRALGGTVSFALRDGAVKGFNIAKMLRSVQDFQQSGAQSLLSGTASSAQQTDFSSLSGSGRIVNGILRSNDLRGASPLLRLTGSGTVNLRDQTLDFLLKPTLVNTATGQGGKQLGQLHGIEVPVKITGPLNAPHYQIALRQLLQQKATGKLQKTLKDERKTLQDKLKGLLEHGL